MSTEKPVSAAPTESVSTDPVDRVIRYHIQTKHHFNRYARALGYLDWANQPDPFRRFEGAPLIPLPLLKPDEEPVSPAYEAIYQADAALPQSISLRTISRFFEFAPEQIARLLAPFPSGAFLFGLTSVHWREAWKYGERAFRCCNHDIGHAIGTARFAASTLGWNMALLDGLSQDTTAMLLGTQR